MKCEKEPWKMTLQEYADSIYNDPTQVVLCKESIVADLNRYKQLLDDTLTKRIKPSSVIGTGYKNPRMAAIEWLEQRIEEYQAIVDGTIIHPIVKANYETDIRIAIGQGLISSRPAFK
jgi:hypothetical protein